MHKQIAMAMAAGGMLFIGAAAPRAAEVQPAAPAGRPVPTVILNEGSYWRYHLTARKPVYRKDQQLTEMPYGWAGSALPPAEWAAPDFDDQLWVSAQGPFFGTGHGWAWVKEVDGKGYTYYEGTSESMALLCVRGRFQVTDPASAGDLTLSLTYRGGVVVYLNGKEVARGNLPDPEKKGLEALAEDYPAEAYGNKDGKPIGIYDQAQKNVDRLELRLRKLTDVKIPAASLQKGVNTLAIEVHRAPYNEVILKSVAAHNVQTFDWVPMGLVAMNLKASGAGVVPNTMRPKGLQAWGQSIASGMGPWQYCNPLEQAQPVHIYGARNGVSVGEVVVSSSEAIKDLKVECSSLTGPSAIPPESVSVRYGIPEKAGGWSGAYDVLDPVPPALVGVDGGTGGAVQPVILTVRLPKDVKAGAYSGRVTIKVADVAPVELPLNLNVADWVMPDAKNFQMNMGLYESPESVALQYKVPMWSEEHWKLMDKVFGYMAELGADDVYIPVELKTHLGNSQSMVRWIAKEGSGASRSSGGTAASRSADGGAAVPPNGAQPSETQGAGNKDTPETRNLKPETYAPDFSLVERYLDLAVKHLGKPANVVCILWDFNNGTCYGGGKPKPASTGFRYTIYDPKTGKTEDAEGPKYGTPEIREFLKPVAEGLRKVAKDRGLEGSMMLGILGDCTPPGDVYADLAALFPDTKWAWAAHQFTYEKARVAYETFVYHQYVPNEPWEGHRAYGWKAERRMSCNRREGLSSGQSPLTYRFVVESRLMCGYMGLSMLGIDFWPVLAPLGNLGAGTLGRRYPDVDWNQLNFGVGTGSIVSAGKDGPMGTLRFENLRVGVQESEARIVIEKALTDPLLKAKLGEALAKRSQEFLDERQRQTARTLLSGYYFTGMEWEKNTGDLYQLAGEVAAALAK